MSVLVWPGFEEVGVSVFRGDELPELWEEGPGDGDYPVLLALALADVEGAGGEVYVSDFDFHGLGDAEAA